MAPRPGPRSSRSPRSRAWPGRPTRARPAPARGLGRFECVETRRLSPCRPVAPAYYPPAGKNGENAGGVSRRARRHANLLLLDARRPRGARRFEPRRQSAETLPHRLRAPNPCVAGTQSVRSGCVAIARAFPVADDGGPESLRRQIGALRRHGRLAAGRAMRRVDPLRLVEVERCRERSPTPHRRATDAQFLPRPPPWFRGGRS